MDYDDETPEEINLVEVSEIEDVWNVADTRIIKYTCEIFHRGLNEHKIISATEEDIVKNKIDLQLKKWAEKWEKIESKRKLEQSKQANADVAKNRSEDASVKLNEIENLLIHTLSINDAIDWEELKSNEEFSHPYPTKPESIELVITPESPSEPNQYSELYLPTQFNWFERLFESFRTRKIKKCRVKYSEAMAAWSQQRSAWENEKLNVDEENTKTIRRNEREQKKWEKAVASWEEMKLSFLKQQLASNCKIDELKNQYYALNPNSIIEYCEMVLNNSVYPESFSKNFQLDYLPESKILIVEYELPPLWTFPRVKEVRYLASKDELRETQIPENQLNKMFDDSMYKITLRSLHELFEADLASALEAISFNGWIRSINKATGKEANNCILSIQAKKNDFMAFDLANIDARACFKNLKGVAASKLSSITPIQPVLQINTKDKRFVESREVVNKLDSSTNLAAMDWEDFEHLIRELFEKEFSSNGGEVKVTQGSRDGGVDAIAFDPDPIRGGKIVIQAKRYTNTVGVSAVRDLCAVVSHEGANKGILVSTAGYGPDAYEFVKGKPITLLDGSNLLYLLQKHGIRAHIDLKEAKKIMSEIA